METPIEVRVGRLPGRLYDVGLNGGRSVETALDAAEIEFTEGEDEIRVNSAPADLDQDLNNGDTVTVVAKITGN